MMKKIAVILVVCVLLFSSLDVLAQTQSGFGPDECCFSFFAKRLPKDNVVGFRRTGAQCVQDGIVFTMKNGAKICTDRTLDWVQNVITHVEARTAPENPDQ